MHTWYLPATTQNWFLRLLSLRTLVVLVALFVFVFAEFRFDWIERTAGAYLVTTNQVRPQSGSIWEQGHQTHLARKKLESFVHERRNALQEARRAGSLGQVVETISAESGAMISAEHFVELYQKLPPVLSHEIISPYALLSHRSAGRWQRTFFERQDGQLLIFFLDNDNQVLHRLVLNQALISHIRRGEVAIDSNLEQLADLRSHIYEAERFFNTLNSFPSGVRDGVIAHPQDLLRISGRIARVGISDHAVAGTIDVGFEIEAAEGTKVIFMQGRQEDVRRVQQALEGRSYEHWYRRLEQGP